jgi:hypothetical protein
MAYNINSDKGKKIAKDLKAGQSYSASDGSKWVKNNDGSISVTTKSGNTSTAVVGGSSNSNTNTGGSNKGSSGGSSIGSGGGGSSPDYSVILKDLLGNNPGNYNNDIVSMVQNALDSRSSKIASDPSLAKYANDDIMLAARNYLDAAKNYNIGQDAFASLEELKNMEYNSMFDKDIKSLIGSLMNRDEFSYDFQSDPSFKAFASTFDMLGDQAMQDTLADVAGLTGGLPSSAAVSAGAQAKNSWNSRLTDVIPTLMDAAYSRYQNGIATDQNLLAALGDLDSNAFGQFANQRDAMTNISKYLSDFGYNAGQDDKLFNYQVSKDKIMDDRWLKQFSADEQQRLIQNAIDNRQISVSEGNLALSRARFDYEQEQDALNNEDTSHYGGMLSEMMSSPDPNKWLAENAPILSAEEIAWLKKMMPDDNTNNYF